MNVTEVQKLNAYATVAEYAEKIAFPVAITSLALSILQITPILYGAPIACTIGIGTISAGTLLVGAVFSQKPKNKFLIETFGTNTIQFIEDALMSTGIVSGLHGAAALLAKASPFITTFSFTAPIAFFFASGIVAGIAKNYLEENSATLSETKKIVLKKIEDSGLVSLACLIAWAAMKEIAFLVGQPIIYPASVCIIAGGAMLSFLIYRKIFGNEYLKHNKTADENTQSFAAIFGFVSFTGAAALAIKATPILATHIPIAIPLTVFFSSEYIYKKATQFLKKTQYDLAEDYLNGQKTITDENEEVDPILTQKEGQKWLEASVKYENVHAQNLLGYYYLYGQKGYSVDPQKGIQFLEAAIKQRNLAAKYNLGCYYVNNQNENKGLKFLEHVAKSKRSDRQLKLKAQTALYKYHFNHNNNKLTVKWLKILAENNHSPAQLQLGYIFYLNGHFSKALKWFRQALKNNGPGANYWLGLVYLKGKGVEKDLSQAKIFFLEHIKHSNRHARSYYYLGKCCLLLNKQEEGYEYLQKAYQLGSRKARVLLGLPANDQPNQPTPFHRQILSEQLDTDSILGV